MDPAAVTRYITETFDGVRVDGVWGDTFFFYDPDLELAGDIYFATMKTQDDDSDRVSDLARGGLFRLNIGLGKESYRALVQGAGEAPDYTVPDVILPHPLYAGARWVCVLAPSDAFFEARLRPLLAEAHALAVEKHARRG
jgi:hypothetical protein